MRDDLLIATVFPVSLQAHQFTLIVKRSGEYEFVDQISGSESSQHIVRAASESQLARTESSLTNLIPSLDMLAQIQLDDIDPDVYESNDRRNIRFWTENGPSGCAKLNPSFYNSIPIDPECVETFVQNFDKLWLVLIALVPDAHFELGPSNRFPLQTKQT